MAPPIKVTDAEIMRAVRDCRREDGACTVPFVARRLNMSATGLDKRIQKLIAAGRLTRSEVPGSLRPTPRTRKPASV